MRHAVVALSLGILVALTGCDRGTSGGPGATTPTTSRPMTGQTDDTFSLNVPSVKLAQGESETVSIGIRRGTNFSEDVSITLAGLPTGVTVDPGSPRIAAGDSEAEITVRATNTAALGDFEVKVTGQPTQGLAAESELNVTVTEREVDTTSSDATVMDSTTRDNEILALERQLEVYEQQNEELRARAAQATGQAKVELDERVVEADQKIATARTRLSEARSSTDDNWGRVKTSVASAYDDLRNMFN